jgi:hypothetical protein
LQKRFPECDDLAMFAASYTSHLSVGQAKSADASRRLLDQLQASWQPLWFELTVIAMIQRGPDTPFQVVGWASLGDNRAHTK